MPELHKKTFADEKKITVENKKMVERKNNFPAGFSFGKISKIWAMKFPVDTIMQGKISFFWLFGCPIITEESQNLLA